MRQALKHIFAAGVLFLLPTVGGCGFAHRLPLRDVYDRINIGETLPNELTLPAGASRTDDLLISVIALNLEWERSTGGVERVVILRGVTGEVLAKHYAVEAEELSLVTLTYKHIDHYEWVLRADDVRTENLDPTFARMDAAVRRASVRVGPMDTRLGTELASSARDWVCKRRYSTTYCC